MTVHVSVREVRAALKTYLNGEDAVIVGDNYRPRAVLIPINLPGYLDDTERKKAAKHILKEAKRIAKELLQQY